MFREGFIVKELKNGNIEMSHEEWRKMKLYLFGNKKFEVDKDIYLYKKIKELKKLNGECK